MPPILSSDFTDLPGESLIRQGLEDLAAGRESVAALLVQIGAPRLRWIGVALPLHSCRKEDADRRLYQLLAVTHDNEAHSQYNSLVRQLVSFERALERRVWSRQRALANP